MKLVIADDEPLARERLRSLLSAHADVEVVAEAENGLEALQACSQQRPDAVLLDIAMPGVDGIEAARHLSAFEPRPADRWTGRSIRPAAVRGAGPRPG